MAVYGVLIGCILVVFGVYWYLKKQRYHKKRQRFLQGLLIDIQRQKTKRAEFKRSADHLAPKLTRLHHDIKLGQQNAFLLWIWSEVEPLKKEKTRLRDAVMERKQLLNSLEREIRHAFAERRTTFEAALYSSYMEKLERTISKEFEALAQTPGVEGVSVDGEVLTLTLSHRGRYEIRIDWRRGDVKVRDATSRGIDLGWSPQVQLSVVKLIAAHRFTPLIDMMKKSLERIVKHHDKEKPK